MIASRLVSISGISDVFLEGAVTYSNEAKVRTLKVKEETLKNIPMGTFGEPEDVAKAVAFLAAEGSYLTGQVLAVDGGMVM